MRVGRALALTIFLSVSGCASFPSRPTPPEWLTVREDQEAKSFVLTLENRSNRRLCIHVTSWPTTGYIASTGTVGSDDVYVEEGGTKFRARSFHDPVFTDRVYHVKPGATFRGLLRFDQFPGPDFSNPNPTRRLHFPLKRHRCWFGVLSILQSEDEENLVQTRFDYVRELYGMVLEPAPTDMSKPLPPIAPSRP
jgi:hypothetical protein